MYTIIFKEDEKKHCDHRILIVGKEYDLDYHSSSPLHHGVCLFCKQSDTWEIRHLDYVVIGPQNKSLKFPYCVVPERILECNKPYTEKELIQKLVEVYQPEYIMHGRRCLYAQESGIYEDVLWK